MLYFTARIINDLNYTQLHARPQRIQTVMIHLIQVSIQAKASSGVRSQDRHYPGWTQGGGIYDYANTLFFELHAMTHVCLPRTSKFLHFLISKVYFDKIYQKGKKQEKKCKGLSWWFTGWVHAPNAGGPGPILG